MLKYPTISQEEKTDQTYFAFSKICLRQLKNHPPTTIKKHFSSSETHFFPPSTSLVYVAAAVKLRMFLTTLILAFFGKKWHRRRVKTYFAFTHFGQKEALCQKRSKSQNSIPTKKLNILSLETTKINQQLTFDSGVNFIS